MSFTLLPVLLLLPFAGAALLLAVPNSARRLAAWCAGLITIAALVCVLVLAMEVFRGAVVSWRVEWLPSLGVAFGLRMDGLALMFALLITAIGSLIVLYGAYYLAAEDPAARFFSMLLLFMGAMLGVVLADNLILLVVFWELTSISSFLLIGFWRHRADAREGARMALTVTGAGGLALLAGVLLLGHVVGSYDLERVFAAREKIQASSWYVPILLLFLLGAFTKSAQFPFHFWLPRAMAAPTPVSAFLHSATMVKAGVFLLARMYPALGGSEPWFWIVSTAGIATLLLGAVVAIFQHDLKGLLAYSTISHLGLITLLFGLDSPLAVVAGVFHILNHAIFKASLFMAAGIIDHETGSRDMRQLNGLWKAMPITATLAMVAAAAMAGVPLANGFLSKEMFFAETLFMEQHVVLEWITPIAATIAGIASVAYSLRFIHDVFFNGEPVGLTKTPHEPPRFMRVPVEALVVICLAVGILPSLTVGPLLAVAGAATLQAALPEYKLAIWHGFNVPLLMSAIALAGGIGLYFVLQKTVNLHRVAKLPGDGKRVFDSGFHALIASAERLIASVQNGSMQRYVLLTVCVALLAGLAAFLFGTDKSPDGGAVAMAVTQQNANVVFLAVWVIGLGAALSTAVWHAQRLIALIFLGTVGLIVSLTFVYFSAPDLALTQLLVEVVSIMLMMLALHFLPPTGKPERQTGRKLRDLAIAGACGAGVAWIVYQVLTRPFDSISPFFLGKTVPEGGGANAVNVIIVDFRGFDTMGEIAVLSMAAMIVAMLLAGMPRHGAMQPLLRVEPDGVRHPLLLRVVASLLMPLAIMISIYFFLRGHNQPGGGFIAGLLFATAMLLQYVAHGARWMETNMVLDGPRWIGWGLFAAVLTGMGSFFVAFPFLTSTTRYFSLPILGDVPIASAMFFDLGVYLAVIGATMLALTAFASLTRTHEPAPRAGGSA
jgi:multicomponent K+:H+ antiporter subunit A